MGVLIRGGVAALVGLAGCYSPDLPDCVVACQMAADCAPSQVCGADRLCASPELAGQCREVIEPDARPAPGPDAADSPDAEPAGILRVVITGRGKVKVEPPVDKTCESFDANGTLCAYAIQPGMLTLKETDGHGWSFDQWTQACASASAGTTCILTVGLSTTVAGAIFLED